MPVLPSLFLYYQPCKQARLFLCQIAESDYVYIMYSRIEFNVASAWKAEGCMAVGGNLERTFHTVCDTFPR